MILIRIAKLARILTWHGKCLQAKFMPITFSYISLHTVTQIYGKIPRMGSGADHKKPLAQGLHESKNHARSKIMPTFFSMHKTWRTSILDIHTGVAKPGDSRR